MKFHFGIADIFRDKVLVSGSVDFPFHRTEGNKSIHRQNSKAAPHMSLPMRGSMGSQTKGEKEGACNWVFVETMIASSTFNHQQFGICNHMICYLEVATVSKVQILIESITGSKPRRISIL